MLHGGMYEASGEWGATVGLPAKNGGRRRLGGDPKSWRAVRAARADRRGKELGAGDDIAQCAGVASPTAQRVLRPNLAVYLGRHLVR